MKNILPLTILLICVINVSAQLPGCASGTLNTFPYNEDFESGMGMWVNNVSGDDEFDWTRDQNGTPNDLTGPPDGDPNFYMYIEVSNTTNTKKAYLESGCIDLTTLTNPQIDFDYHLYGNKIGPFHLFISTDGINWTSLFFLEDDQGNSWKTASINLSAYTNNIVQFRFRGTRGTGGKGDAAIDNISIFEPGTAVPNTPTNTTSVANLSICNGETTELSASGVGTLSWYDASTGGNFLGSGSPFVTPSLTSNTTYYVQDSTANGASNRRTVTVNVANAINTSTTLAQNTITADETGAIYKWLDCNNSNAIITGETNQEYVATMSGDYAVEVTVGNCVETSACVNVSIVGINESDFDNSIKTYPNPINNLVTIELDEILGNTHVSVLSADGKLVYNNSNIEDNKIIINTDSWNSGVFIFQISNENSTKTLKLIKQ